MHKSFKGLFSGNTEHQSSSQAAGAVTSNPDNNLEYYLIKLDKVTDSLDPKYLKIPALLVGLAKLEATGLLVGLLTLEAAQSVGIINPQAKELICDYYMKFEDDESLNFNVDKKHYILKKTNIFELFGQYKKDSKEHFESKPYVKQRNEWDKMPKTLPLPENKSVIPEKNKVTVIEQLNGYKILSEKPESEKKHPFKIILDSLIWQDGNLEMNPDNLLIDAKLISEGINSLVELKNCTILGLNEY